MKALEEGKSCEKNYSSVRRYVADPVNVFPEWSITKLILKEAGKLIQNLLLNQNYLKSKAIEDIISIGSFVEVLVLKQYSLECRPRALSVDGIWTEGLS
ncbi:hypothetical protein Tco_1047843 [Tanacetum coccineum]